MNDKIGRMLDKSEQFIIDHPNAFIWFCTVFGLVLGWGCWEVEKRSIARQVVRYMKKRPK